jgi:hypothetical protein
MRVGRLASRLQESRGRRIHEVESSSFVRLSNAVWSSMQLSDKRQMDDRPSCGDVLLVPDDEAVGDVGWNVGEVNGVVWISNGRIPVGTTP